MSGAPTGYIEVGERIQLFYAKFPEGSLVAHHKPFVETVGDKTFIVYCAAAYRTPDDPRPGIGYAWEPVPGPTPFTKDSELMNAETSAWGRAIAALGFETREHIASREEVQARTGDTGEAKTTAQNKKIFALIKDLDTLGKPPPPHADWKAMTEARCHELYSKGLSQLTKDEASQLIEAMSAHVKAQMDAPGNGSGFQAPVDTPEQPSLVSEEDAIPF